MHRGYIKLWRKIGDWEWFTDVETCHLFIYLLLHARSNEGRWRGIPIYKGEIVQSIETIADRSGLTIRNVRTAIKHLQVTGEVTERYHGKHRIIKLKNYEVYHQSDTIVAEELTGKRQGSDREVTANKKEKKEKNDNYVGEKIVKWLMERGIGNPDGYLVKMTNEFGIDIVEIAWKKAHNLPNIQTPSDLYELCKKLHDKKD